MDARENILRAVRFERPESIPMIFHINPACWHHYPQSTLQALMEAHPGLFPDFQRSEEPIETEYLPYARAGIEFTDPWGCVWQTTDNGIVGTVTKHPLESWQGQDANLRPPGYENTPALYRLISAFSGRMVCAGFSAARDRVCGLDTWRLIPLTTACRLECLFDAFISFSIDTVVNIDY